MRGTNMWTPRSVKKDVRTHIRAEIPLQYTVRWQADTLQPMEVKNGANICLQPMEDPKLEQVDATEEGCDIVERPCCSNQFLKD